MSLEAKIRVSFEFEQLLHNSVHSIHNFGLSNFDKALYKATDRANATHGVNTRVSDR